MLIYIYICLNLKILKGTGWPKNVSRQSGDFRPGCATVFLCFFCRDSAASLG